MPLSLAKSKTASSFTLLLLNYDQYILRTCAIQIQTVCNIHTLNVYDVFTYFSTTYTKIPNDRIFE